MQLVLASQTVNTLPLRKKLGIEYSLKEKYELIDTVMFIPIDETKQVRISIYQKLKDNSQWLDLRPYHLISGNWQARNGIQIPLNYLEQLSIRINALQRKHKTKG